MKNRMEQIEEMLRDAGANTDSDMLDALEDGALLAHLGITDGSEWDVEDLEALHDKYIRKEKKKMQCSAAGKIGGSSAWGDKKRRSPEHYRAMVEARRKKREQ